MTRPALALVTADPAGPVAVRKPRAKPTPESVAKLSQRLKRSGRSLSLDLAAKAKALAVDALAVSSLPLGVTAPGVADDARRTADALVAFAQRLERLAK